MEWISQHGPQIVEVASYVVAGATIIAKMTENKVDNKIVNKARKVVDFFAIHTESTKDKEE